jgi:hypothetical protein
MNNREKPFLRLIASQEPIEQAAKGRSKTKRHRQVQLGLPYEHVHCIVFVDAGRASSEQFFRLLRNLRPKWIVDVRPSPRFDVLLGSRQFAFQAFAELSAKYVDLFGELGIGKARVVDVNPGLWSGEIAERIKLSKTPDGPYLFLFDDASLMDAARWEVPHNMKVILGKPIGAASDGLRLFG